MSTDVPAESNAHSYQECLLEITRDGFVQDRSDIGRIKSMCEKRFPDSAPNIIGDKLNDKALDKIDLYTNWTEKGEITGSVYNGNPDLIVTRLQVLFTPKTDKGSVMDFFDSEEYYLNLKIKPFSTATFSIDPKKTKIRGPLGWKLVRAWGY